MTNHIISWPKKGDRLFKSDVDWYHNACLNYLPEQWDAYADGYKQAGDFLVENVKRLRRHQDTLVFPIVFLYRHYLELRLKEIIKHGYLLLSIRDELPKHHRIESLWKQARRIMERLWPEGRAADLDAVEDRIREFSEKDPSSVAFRYPTDKDNKPSLPNLRHVNLRNLSEVLDRLSSLLDGVSMAISHSLEQKWEMEQECSW